MLKFIGSRVLFIFFVCTTARADNVHLLLAGGVNFLLPHTEQLRTFIIEPFAPHSADYFPGPLFGLGFAYQKNHWAIGPNYYFIYNNLDQARGPDVATTTSNLTKGYTYSHNLFIDGAFFITQSHYIKPYLGAGVGFNYVYVNQSLGFPFISPLVIRDRAFAFAYNVFIGISYHLTDFLNLDVKVRYLDSQPKIHDQFGDITGLNYQNIGLFIGLDSKL